MLTYMRGNGGGFYYDLDGQDRNVTEAFSINRLGQFQKIGEAELFSKEIYCYEKNGIVYAGLGGVLSNPFTTETPSLRHPGDNSSVWDWAFIFCVENCWGGGNASERKMMDALADPEFMSISESVQISYWDGVDYDDIEVFDKTSHNDLARNAQYWAACYGEISIPGLARATKKFKSETIKPRDGDLF